MNLTSMTVVAKKIDRNVGQRSDPFSASSSVKCGCLICYSCVRSSEIITVHTFLLLTRCATY